MKKVVFLLMMLAGCMGGVQAQKVASTPTSPSDIKDGYYVLLAKTGEGTKTDEAGAFVYYNSSDNKIYYDAKGATTNLLGKTVESVDEFKYFFHVEKNSDGKVKICAWSTNTCWQSVSKATIVRPHPGQVDQITQASDGASFTLKATDGKWCRLFFPGTYYDWGVRNCTDYVVLNDNQQVGYKDDSSSADAQFQFYAVSNVPEDVVTFTYNYTFEGVSRKKSGSRMGVIGRDFPAPNDVLPDYVVANKPSRKVAAEDNGQSIEIVCTENFPFKTSTDNAPVYYYLENVMDAGTRLYGNGGLKYRAAENASAVNDVRNDLWYVTGNAFDGLQFHSVGTGQVAKTNLTITASNLCWLTANNSGYNDKWFVYRISDSTFGIHAYSIVKEDFAWNMEDDKDNVRFRHPGKSDAFAFRMVEPTFTFPMYNGGDRNVYNTFAAPFDVALADDNVKMYKGSVNTAIHELTLSQVDAAPAEAGVMLLGENSSVNEVMLKAVSGVAALEGNSLVGITGELSDLTGKLILGISDQTGAVGFFTAGSSVASLQANHAYLPWADSQVKGISMRIEGEATSIGKIEGGQTNASGNGAIYDLMGRRVLRTEKGGFYIQNGRKFIVK